MMVGRKRESVYKGKDMKWKPKEYSQHFGSDIAARTFVQEKVSSSVLSLSAARRFWMKFLSAGEMNFAVAG